MKTDFLLAITQLAAERNLPKEVVYSAVETALASAYKKDDVGAHYNVAVKIHPASGDVKVYAIKAVVDKVADDYHEITLEAAQQIKKDAQLGEAILVEVPALHGGRIAAQTAKQVVLQRLREAEREFIFGEYSNKEGEVVSGVVQRTDLKQVIIDLGKAEGLLPAAEQVKTERYRPGQRLKVYLLEVNRGAKGPRLIFSRSHPNLVKRLFELEVPEIRNGIVEVKAIAREPGFRSKVAVAAKQDGIDPVGSCVGLRGVRIQNVVNELYGERVDVIQWHPQPRMFIANALSPSQVTSVEVKEEEKTATVVVPDGQLSLAIGKEGQNARLAARLTGWKIDIKSASAAEAERAQKAAAAAEAAFAVAPAVEEVPPAEAPVPVAAAAEPAVAVAAAEPEAVAEEAVAEEAPEPVPAAAEALLQVETPQVETGVEVPRERPQLRFAEDIFGARTSKFAGKAKDRDKKKKKPAEGADKEAVKLKKKRKLTVTPTDQDVDDYLEAK